MRIAAAGLLSALGVINLQQPWTPCPTLGAVLADKVVPFNKGPRPAGCATAEQKSARWPVRGKGTRKARRRAT